MLSPEDSSDALRRLFEKRRVATLSDLFRVLRTASRMSVFRRLRAVGYMSSITHRGRFYTLPHIPAFDPVGLWFHGGVGFSVHGTLRVALIKLVEEAKAGKTHQELRALLCTRSHDTLVDLVREQRLGRSAWRGRLVYVSADPERAEDQLHARSLGEGPPSASVPVDVIIAILLEVIRTGGVLVPRRTVLARLVAQRLAVSATQVDEVYRTYQLESGKKKAAARRSRSSNR